MKILFLSTLTLVSLHWFTTSTVNKVNELFGSTYTHDIYSGYLNTDIQGNELFYIFTPSQSSTPETDPVLLWLNGGPGCSSLAGLLTENGPVVQDLYANEFHLNEYPWNLNINVVYIESPAGVGFSKVADPTAVLDDDITSKGLLNALKEFFAFDEFKKWSANSFFISGESYAGVYIPFLAKAIITDTAETGKINWKGVWIGNGWTDFETDVERSMVDFGFWHSIISIETYNEFEANCPHLNPESNDFNPRNVTQRCNEIRREIKNNYEGIDIYGIYRQCATSPNQEATTTSYQQRIAESLDKIRITKYNETYNLSSEEEIGIWPAYCGEDAFMHDFLNKAETKTKWHVNDMEREWTMCSSTINYTMSESFSFYSTFISEHPELRVWFFSGDADAVLPTLGSQRWIQKWKLGIDKESRPWYARNQIGGYVQTYEGGFTFVTIKGAGHMVPQDKREESKAMLDAFIKGSFDESDSWNR